MHNLFLVYLSISTCFGWLCAHHQEKQLCLCDTWYLLFCVDDCLVCRMHTKQSSTQNNKYQVSHKCSCFSWWWAHSCPKHVEKRNRHTPRKIVHQVVSIYKIIQGCPVNRTLQITFMFLPHKTLIQDGYDKMVRCLMLLAVFYSLLMVVSHVLTIARCVAEVDVWYSRGCLQKLAVTISPMIR